MAKPSIPKGTRDFSPSEVAKRKYIIQKIQQNFEKFGFQPIETPSFENSETLMGKYGEEGDRLIFKILNSGDFFKEHKNLISGFIKAIFNSAVYQLSEKINGSNKKNLLLDLNEKFGVDNVNKKEIYKSFDESYDNVYEEVLNEFVSEDYITGLIEEINSKKSENKIKNFYSEDFKEIILDEIRTFRQSKVLNKKIYNALVECDTCDVLKNDIINDFISRRIYRVLGIYFDRIESKNITNFISEKALRYDLTVPFARYVVQHQNEIDFPFKRYQIQPVWRADRPQKGRFREFFQCDADVVGSKSLWQEVEFIQLYDAVFTDLGLQGVTIKINNRKILSGISEVIDAQDKLIDFTVALDKLDKIGEDGVKKEMLEKGISTSAIEKVQPLFSLTGTFTEKIKQLSALLQSSEEGMKGIAELTFIDEKITALGLQTAQLELEVTLARGLNYYTGAIFEVSAPKEVSMGSIGGGGRYDDLTGIFGLKDVSGVGISFGLDRIGLVMEELHLFPTAVLETSKAIFINYGETEGLYSLKAIKALRAEGIKVEMYPDAAKIGKQLNYADKRGILYAVLAGDAEMKKDVFILKNLSESTQQEVTLNDLKKILK